MCDWRKPRSMQLFAAALLISVVATCGPKTTATPTEIEPATEATETLVSPPSADVSLSPTPTLVPSLNTAGPWFVFFSGKGEWADTIWAVNPDGTGLTELASGLIVARRNRGSAISPMGGYLAFITATDEEYRGLSLNLLKLPEGEVIRLSLLSSSLTEPEPGADPNLPQALPLSVITSIAHSPSLAWSPNGRQLAFVGAQDGLSADLYVYSLEHGSIRRLDDGPSEASTLSWSPDSKWIVYFGLKAVHLAGSDLVGAWAVTADGSGIRELEILSGKGGEEVFGWLGEHSMALYTFNTTRGGAFNLRTFNIETGSTSTLWEGGFTEVALDPNTRTFLLAEAPHTGAPGLYLIVAEGIASRRIVEEGTWKVTWSEEAGLFFARTEYGVLAVSPQGDFMDLVVPVVLPEWKGAPSAVAPGTRQLAWEDSSMWTGSLLNSIDNPPLHVFNESTYQAAWSPQGEFLLFFAEDGLYRAQSTGYEPSLVVRGLNSLQSAWVWP